ncbi:MAG: hypothetical protein IT580_05335 [Verrucomicrobiales bacterium]|nr:hypothetical protein [Verrucomicrobiales bacterium]
MDSRLTDFVFTQFGITGLVLIVILGAAYTLSVELAKLRTDLQQQLAKDLLNRRFEAYSRLWAKLRPLAIYADHSLTPTSITALSTELSDWYFSTEGGLFLTTRCRDFYFALQDTLRFAQDLQGWTCDKRPLEPKELFENLLRQLAREEKISFDVCQLKEPEKIDPKVWLSVCQQVEERLRSLNTAATPQVGEWLFATIQQVSSVLRTNLAHELHSRLELRLPAP